jgi:hypothetical protein
MGWVIGCGIEGNCDVLLAKLKAIALAKKLMKTKAPTTPNSTIYPFSSRKKI